MPGIFAIYSTDPSIPETALRSFMRAWGKISVERHGNWVMGGHAFHNAKPVRRINRQILGCDGEGVSYRRLAMISEVPDIEGELAAELR